MDVSTVNALIAAGALLIGGLLGSSVQRYIANKASDSNKFITKLELYNRLNQSLETIVRQFGGISALSITGAFGGKTFRLGKVLDCSGGIMSVSLAGIPEELLLTTISDIDNVLLLAGKETKKALVDLKSLLSAELNPFFVNEVPSGLHKIWPELRLDMHMEDAEGKKLNELVTYLLSKHKKIATACEVVQPLLSKELQ